MQLQEPNKFALTTPYPGTQHIALGFPYHDPIFRTNGVSIGVAIFFSDRHAIECTNGFDADSNHIAK
jgi:hypothetical protein